MKHEYIYFIWILKLREADIMPCPFYWWVKVKEPIIEGHAFAEWHSGLPDPGPWAPAPVFVPSVTL